MNGKLETKFGDHIETGRQGGEQLKSWREITAVGERGEKGKKEGATEDWGSNPHAGPLAESATTEEVIHITSGCETMTA